MGNVHKKEGITKLISKYSCNSHKYLVRDLTYTLDTVKS
jgi:hypothetical protein